MLGRSREKQQLSRLLNSGKSELLAVFGRRRVGKTYLINEYYKENLVFDFTGTQYASKANQLNKFHGQLLSYSKSKKTIDIPKDWSEAFQSLSAYMERMRKRKLKRVIFFDELPWIASPRSGFLEEFSYWWNSWASNQDIVVVICGSAASWMIEKVVNHKGGLYNRITSRIHLEPFTLAEVKEYLDAKGIKLTHYQIVQLYMTIGGIPHYLQHIRQGLSTTQIINELCFQKDGILRDEFDNLYAALYNGHERHVEIVKALATTWKGMSRQDIIKATSLSDGGGISKILQELTTASFVTEILPYGKNKKETLYRLTDEYSLFYLKFIAGKRAGNKNFWLKASKENTYKIWCGYAFENICIKHVEAIKKALGIDGVHTQVSGYKSEGLQIDMLIDRADDTINLCEMKFYNTEYTITKEYAAKLRERRALFQEATNNRKLLQNTIVTTYPLKPNMHSLEVIDNTVNMHDLFEVRNF